MGNWTEGEWEIEYDNADDGGGGQWFSVGPAKVWYSYGSSREEEAEALASAYLIAAAKDLYWALKELEESDLLADNPYFSALMSNALAKARGES